MRTLRPSGFLWLVLIAQQVRDDVRSEGWWHASVNLGVAAVIALIIVVVWRDLVRPRLGPPERVHRTDAGLVLRARGYTDAEWARMVERVDPGGSTPRPSADPAPTPPPPTHSPTGRVDHRGHDRDVSCGREGYVCLTCTPDDPCADVSWTIPYTPDGNPIPDDWRTLTHDQQRALCGMMTWQQADDLLGELPYSTIPTIDDADRLAEWLVEHGWTPPT